jgi:spore coat polysaccharide biosynthesis predicted glycosyltransferase SpsG
MRVHTPNVLFVAAAGPRIGFGHLVRAGVVAGALDVRRRVVLRASSPTQEAARTLGWDVLAPAPAIVQRLQPDLVVIDDPSARRARPWARAARACRVPVVAIRDLGRGAVDADLSIDGSFTRNASGARADLEGPAFALLDPVVAALRAEARVRDANRVVVAVGGGGHVAGIGLDIARAIRARLPDVAIDLAPGFHARPHVLPEGCRWLDAHRLREALAMASVVVSGGGITLYEACALGAPVVAVAVVPAQRPTTATCAALGAAIDATASDQRESAERAARSVAAVLGDAERRAALAGAARRLVDGQGTTRVLAHIRALLLTRPRGDERHAA